ncbi:MAG: hypothetical protein LBL79_13370 [Prevotella sp.]|jgi:hypothetical protein|nr:hypothetical protein [Prevotella sp.]
MKVKLIRPALTEAESPFWRSIKYSLFPPLGLATLAAFLSPDDEIDFIGRTKNFIIKTGGLNEMSPMLESILSKEEEEEKENNRKVETIEHITI